MKSPTLHLKECRQNKGWTQSELVEQIESINPDRNLSQPRIHLFESGAHPVGPSMSADFARVFDQNPDSFFARHLETLFGYLLVNHQEDLHKLAEPDHRLWVNDHLSGEPDSALQNFGRMFKEWGRGLFVWPENNRLQCEPSTIMYNYFNAYRMIARGSNPESILSAVDSLNEG